MEPLSLRRFCQDCIIATRGYNFREGQVTSRPSFFFSAPANTFEFIAERAAIAHSLKVG